VTFYDPHNEFGIHDEHGHRVLRQYRVGKVTVTVTEQPDGQISRAYRNHKRTFTLTPHDPAWRVDKTAWRLLRRLDYKRARHLFGMSRPHYDTQPEANK
jgi:hypothetical protein